MTMIKNIGGSSLATLLTLLCSYCFAVSVSQTLKAQYEDYEPKPVLFCDGKTLAEVILDEYGNMVHCRLHELEEDEDAEAIIKGSGLTAKYPNFKSMLEMINNCTKLAMPLENSTETAPANATNIGANSWSPWSLWNGIVPVEMKLKYFAESITGRDKYETARIKRRHVMGKFINQGTKWCGVGDIADSFEQLGTQADVDACCRAHDHCPVKLKAFRTGYGLINLSLYTKSHCDCDREFYGCLKGSTNNLADAVGNFYFNFMRVQCLREHRPFVCVENRTEVDGGQRCVRWSPDPNSKKMQVTVTQLKY